ncbi:MAG: hypothetical protein J6B04_04680 [Clostridia bacterium]|nr:hypothetical protein [Clostridia bacterium]
MKTIDINTWKRKTHYNNFIKYTNPIFSIGAQIEVTNLVLRCKERGESFFANLLYVATKCINEVEELKTRILNGNVVVYDNPSPSYVVMADDGVIVTANTPFNSDYNAFYGAVRKEIENAKKDSVRGEFSAVANNNCIYFSCLPWVKVTAAQNPYNLTDVEQSTIPRVLWGKYYQDGFGKYYIYFDIAAHHALADGQHIAEAINKIEVAIKNINEFLKGE